MDGMSNAWVLEIGFGWIISLVVLFIIIVLIAESNRRRKYASSKFNSPQEILKTRYAKGEISRDEFDEKRKHIS